MTARAIPSLPLPNWPALLTTEMACAYLSLGEGSLVFLARARGVAPMELAGLHLVRWRKADLDRLIDSLPARGSEIPPDAAPPVDLAQEALKRAERRAR